MLAKFIYASEINSNQSINYLSTKKRTIDYIWKNAKTLIDYSQTVNNVYENLEDYNAIKKRKMLIFFDDTIVGEESNKN